jgi:outer membrane protein assembly factor BamA
VPDALLPLVLALLVAAPEPDAGAPEAPPVTRRYLIERIQLVGLDHTRPSEVRRRLGLAEGEILDDAAVLLSRLRLLQLGWFSRVETHVERGSERGLVVLVYEFTERNTLVVSDLFIGSTGPQPFYGGFGLTQGNFLGVGLGLAGAFVYGGSPAERPFDPPRFALRGALFNPDFSVGKLPLVLAVSAVGLRGEEFLCSDPDCSSFTGHFGAAPRIRYDRLGGELTLGIRPGPFERLLAGYRLERVGAERVAVPADVPAGTGPRVNLGRSFVSALTGTYDRDTRNDLFFPTDGTHLALTIVLGTEVLGSDYEFSRYLLQLESDHALPWGHALKLSAAGGVVQGDAPFFERFYAADFAYFSIGPALGRALELNFSTDSRYDAYLGMVGAEYGIPLWRGGQIFHRGYLALGARWLYTAARPRAGRTPVSSVPFSAEAALRLDTPIGSFNISTAYLLDVFL